MLNEISSSSIDEDLFELFLYDDESVQKAECKQRLSQFRERSKKMLEKHNWQKYYFPKTPIEIKKASLFERQLLQPHENVEILTDDDSSFVSTIEYSFLMIEDPSKGK